MDEAERCHKLGYILYGRLLAQGTAKEIIASQTLATWAVTGENLSTLAERLRGLPSVEQVAAFGTALHVTGSDATRLEADLAPIKAEPGRRWERMEPGLEDIFIHLMRKANNETFTPAHT
jgi:ABC-2 type transport system ATP-binding protein